MLQFDKVHTATADVRYSAEQSLGELFAAAIGFIHRQYFVILLILLATIGLALAYIFTTPALYTGTASILLDPGIGKVQLFPQSIFSDDPVNSTMVDSQIEILTSENFAQSIVNNLHLIQDPNFSGSTGGLIGELEKRLSLHVARSETELTRRAVRAFHKRLTVGRVGNTYVINVGFAADNPNRAAEIANAVADGFIADQLESKYTTIQRTATWLQARLNELQTQASAAERAVIDYKTAHNIVDTGGHLIDDQQLSELNTALIKARADVAEAQARLNRVTDILRTNQIDPTSSDVATVTDALHDPIITKLRQDYLETAQREAAWSKLYGKNHVAVVRLRNELEGIRTSIIDELKQIAQADKSDYDIAKARKPLSKRVWQRGFPGRKRRIRHRSNYANLKVRPKAIARSIITFNNATLTLCNSSRFL